MRAFFDVAIFDVLFSMFVVLHQWLVKVAILARGERKDLLVSYGT